MPLVFVPYLLVTRRFREAAATVAGFFVTVAVGFAVLPHDSAQWWLHGMFMADGNRTGFMGWAGNQSLRAIITRFAGSIAAGQGPWIAAAVAALAAGLTAAWLLDRAGYPVPALLATALTGLLVSPVSWDHHWVWAAPGIAVAAHYAIAAYRGGAPAAARRAARWLWALVAGIVFVFGAWPDAIWTARGPSATSPSASCGRRPTPTRSSSRATVTSPATSSTTGTASSCCGATPTSSPALP